MESALRNNIKTIYWMTFFQCAMIVTAVFVPLLQRHGLTMSQVLQTQALFALVVATSEVPSGYLADLWGRKNTIIVGLGLIVLSFFWLLFCDSFIDYLIYEAIMGLGMSLGSGADLALLYDSQTALNKFSDQPLANHGNHISRLVSIEGYAGAIAAVMASVLTLFSLDWVLWAQCITSAFAFIFALRLVEAPRQISNESHKDNFKTVVRVIVDKPLVLWTSLSIILIGVISLSAFWLLQKYWEFQGIPVVWFGYLWAIHCVIRGTTAHYVHDLERFIGWRLVLGSVVVLPLCGFLGMGFFGGALGLFFGLAFPITRGLSMVMFYDALNKRLNADFRATVNSLVSLGTRAIFIITAPLLGFLVDTRGVNVSLLILACLFLPATVLILIPLAKYIRREQSEERQK